MEEDACYYEVEKLLRWCWSRPSGCKNKEFLVMWANFLIDDASWIPKANFDYYCAFAVWCGAPSTLKTSKGDGNKQSERKDYSVNAGHTK